MGRHPGKCKEMNCRKKAETGVEALWRTPDSPRDAAAIQNAMRGLVSRKPPPGPLGNIAGVDVSVRGGAVRAAVVVLSFPGLEPIETRTSAGKAEFPYVPGLLAFREAPIMLKAISMLGAKPDLLMVDGQGLAHPRRFGLACHLGLALDTPAIGCAKSRLVGDYDEPASARGASSDLVHDGEVIGKVFRTRQGVKPVFISIGHMADLAFAVDVTLKCLTRYRLPEPIRAAHRAAGEPGPDWPV